MTRARDAMETAAVGGERADGAGAGDTFFLRCGFGHGFTRGEIEELAANGGYGIARPECGEGSSQRATLVSTPS